jgi:hypothetical protein
MPCCPAALLPLRPCGFARQSTPVTPIAASARQNSERSFSLVPRLGAILALGLLLGILIAAGGSQRSVAFTNQAQVVESLLGIEDKLPVFVGIAKSLLPGPAEDILIQKIAVEQFRGNVPIPVEWT